MLIEMLISTYSFNTQPPEGGWIHNCRNIIRF